MQFPSGGKKFPRMGSRPLAPPPPPPQMKPCNTAHRAITNLLQPASTQCCGIFDDYYKERKHVCTHLDLMTLYHLNHMPLI